MLGAPCCSRWGPLGLDGDDLGLHFGALGRIWVRKAWVPFVIHWYRQGAQMSYLALLWGRQHQFEGPGGPKGSMWGLEVCRPEKACGPLWAGIAASCGPYEKNS